MTSDELRDIKRRVEDIAPAGAVYWREVKSIRQLRDDAMLLVMEVQRLRSGIEAISSVAAEYLRKPGG